MRLNLKAFSLATAIVVAIGTLILNVLSVLTGFAAEFFNLIAPFHPGYSNTILGAFIQALWMFAYGYVFGAALALLYNSMAKERK